MSIRLYKGLQDTIHLPDLCLGACWPACLPVAVTKAAAANAFIAWQGKA
jgi:hypothetical protein